MAYDQVSAQFAAANAYANSATSQASSFIAALNSTVTGLQNPQFAFDLQWPTAPTIVTPTTQAVVLPAVNFPADDTGIAPDAPDLTFPIETAPSAPVVEGLVFAPAENLPVPLPPTISETLALPSDPGEWQPPQAPNLLTISICPFGGVNTFGSMAAQLQTLPDDLELAVPATFVAPTEGQYSSAFMGVLRDELRRRIAGGTGIAASVEAQIWARAQSREAGVTAANVAEVVRNAEARGFALPTGAMAAQLRDAQRLALGKFSELSTDIAIKQAELEQANVKHALEQGIALEGRLVDYANSMMARAFDAAKYLAENAVAVFNQQVELYKANQQKVATFAASYRALIDGEQARVAMYAAEVGAERAKTEMNRALVDQQKAQIEVRNSEIALYRERLAAAQAVLALDKIKLEAFSERVKAYTAGISAEANRVEIFNARLKGNQTVVETYGKEIEAYAAKLRAASDAAKSKADVYDARARAFSSEVQAYSTRVSAVAQQISSAVSVETLKLEQSKLDSTNVANNNQTQNEQFRAQIALFEANKSIAVQQAKLISDNYFALRNLVAEASKVAAQVNAQLAASAFGSIQANASINGSSNTSVGYSYGGSVSGAVPPLTAI